MAPFLLDGPAPERILVARALPGLGDVLVAVPALRALRAALPDAHVALLGLPANRWVLDRFGHVVDEVVEFVGWPGIVESTTQDAGAITEFLAGVQARRFDLALQLWGSGILTNPLAAMLGATRTAGAYLPGQYCPDPELYVPYAVGEPEVDRMLAVTTHLGAPEQGKHLEFPVRPEDEAGRDRVLGNLGVAGRYACVHPGATDARRRWPADRFAAACRALSDDGLVPVLTGGKGEVDLCREVAATAGVRVEVAAGTTDLGALAALLASAAVVVTNDTGVAHLAEAVDARSVVVFTWSDPRRWGPVARDRRRTVGPVGDPWGAISGGCGPRCLGEGCVQPECTPVVSDVPSVDDVVAEVRSLLSG